MNKLIKLIIATLILSGIHQAQAADWLNWSNYSKVTGMVREGSYIWIAGHGGVMKIDTATLQKTFYKKTAGQLPSLMVEDITVNSVTGDIWIGTYDNGMVQVHNGQWTLHSYPASTTLYHFAIDAGGTMWCATSAGLYKFANNTFTSVNNLNLSSSWDVQVFPNGKVLVAGHQPVIYDPVTDTIYMPNNTVFGYNTSSIVIENDSSYYFTGEGMGISHIVDTTAYYINDSAVVDMLISDEIVQMKVIDNQLNVLTRTSKLYQYNGSTWITTTANTNAQAIGATVICQDHGKIWLGGNLDGGVLRSISGTTADISLKKWALHSDQVSAISKKSNTEIWVEADDQIGIYNTVSQSFTDVSTLPANATNPGDITMWNGIPIAQTNTGLYQYAGGAWTALNIGGLPTGNILCMTSDTSGNLYIGTFSGLKVVHGTTVTTYDAYNTLALANNNDMVRKIFFDKGRNTLWLATSYGIVKVAGGTFTLINAHNQPQLSYYTYISAIAQDPAGNMWFGTAYGGLIKYDGTDYTLDSVGASIGNQSINALGFDGPTMYAADNVYGFWVRENTTWTNYNSHNSDMTSDNVTGLYVDDSHNVWLSSRDYGTMSAFGVDIYNKTQVVLSIHEPVGNVISSYPNPTTGRLTLQSDNIQQGDEVSLTDIMGRHVGSYKIVNHEIDLANLSDGIYLLHFSDRSLPAVRVVKE